MVHANPRYDAVSLAKINIAEGFYRVWLQVANLQKLGVVLPTSPGQPSLIAFPLTLPSMGWVKSPPYFFSSLTKTVCNLAKSTKLRTRSATTHITAHRLEAVAATPPEDAVEDQSQGGGVSRLPACRTRQGLPPVAAVDVYVYVDDFILMA